MHGKRGLNRRRDCERSNKAQISLMKGTAKGAIKSGAVEVLAMNKCRKEEWIESEKEGGLF